MTEEELQHMLRGYQQRLADAEFQAITTAAKLSTAQARIAELEASAQGKADGAPEG